MLEHFPSAAMLADRTATARRIAASIEEFVGRQHPEDPVRTIEMLHPVFYRATRAFFAGRLQGKHWVAPLILAFKNTDDGIVIDTVMTDDADVRSLFGFSRSYFHVDLPAVGAAIGFLRSIVPTKPIDELYTVVGRANRARRSVTEGCTST
jgi:Isocitrate dehydrogenase kinase/phosphatase